MVVAKCYIKLPAIAKAGIYHIVIDGSKRIGEPNACIVGELGLQLSSPQENLLRGDLSLDQAKLIMDDGVASVNIHREPPGNSKTDVSPKLQVVF